VTISTETYEPPSPGAKDPPELDLGPEPEVAAPLGQPGAQETLALLQELASFERGQFEQAIGPMFQRFEEFFVERTHQLHDPRKVFTMGVVFGGVGVIVALLLLVALGFLFLWGLTVIQR
jgi:hypothetical protein